MKMNNQEQQELIEWLQGNKAVSYQKCTEFQRLAQEIALVALATEPVKLPAGEKIIFHPMVDETCWLRRDDVIAAIKAAGGSVADE